MNKPPSRRCAQCSCLFVPDPRVGVRQVTCGASDCQRARHSERCRAWHAAHADIADSHYEDVIVPFRARQPDYQRRWRLSVRLREIPEKMPSLGSGLLVHLRAAFGQVKVLLSSATSSSQTGVLTAEALEAAKTSLRDAITAFEQLEASVTMLSTAAL